jgi:hypothetical protein
MKILKSAVILWWFLTAGYSTTQIGPFATQADCDRFRTELAGANESTFFLAPAVFVSSACWNDGKRN